MNESGESNIGEALFELESCLQDSDAATSGEVGLQVCEAGFGLQGGAEMSVSVAQVETASCAEGCGFFNGMFASWAAHEVRVVFSLRMPTSIVPP